MKTAEELTIRKSVVVDLPPERAFELFTGGISGWWPLSSYSIHGDEAQVAVLEGRVGGRVYERAADGTEAEWGRVVTWEPPTALVLEWRVNPQSPPTEVEVRFTGEGRRTRVDLEHRGWERYDDRSEEAATGYESGWDDVLGRFTDAAQA